MIVGRIGLSNKKRGSRNSYKVEKKFFKGRISRHYDRTQVYTRYEKRHDFYFVVYMEVVYAGHVVRLQKREVKGRNLLVVAVSALRNCLRVILSVTMSLNTTYRHHPIYCY